MSTSMPEPSTTDNLPAVAAQMADTLRAVLIVADQDKPYPWQGGALKQQLREDITAYELLSLDTQRGEPGWVNTGDWEAMSEGRWALKSADNQTWTFGGSLLGLVWNVVVSAWALRNR